METHVSFWLLKPLSNDFFSAWWRVPVCLGRAVAEGVEHSFCYFEIKGQTEHRWAQRRDSSGMVDSAPYASIIW